MTKQRKHPERQKLIIGKKEGMDQNEVALT